MNGRHGIGGGVWRGRLRNGMRGVTAGAVTGVLLCLLSGCPSPAPTLPPEETSQTSPDAAADTTANSESSRARSDLPEGDGSETLREKSSDHSASDAVSEESTRKSPSLQTKSESQSGTGKSVANQTAQNDSGSGASAGKGETSEPTSSAEKPPATKAKQELFAGWTRPDVVLVFTGEQHGYIEPCGCTGLANQKGGLARRFSLLKSLRERGWTLWPIDTGTQIRRYGIQAEIKFQSTIAGLKQMGYQAIALGPDDLRLSTTMLAGLVVPTGDEPSPFFSSSAELFGDPSFLASVRVLEQGEFEVGVAAVVAPSRALSITSDDIRIIDAEKAVARAVDKLKDCSWKVLIVQGTRAETEKLVGAHDAFDLVVCSGEPGEPTRQPESIPGSRAKLILTGYKAMYAGVVGLWGKSMRYQRVPLDARFPDAPEMLQLLADYQNALKLKGLEGLGIRPLPHPSGQKFVGSAACADCHEEEYAIWKNGVDGKGGPHAHATESLVHPGERSEIPRHYDPECLSCHVTGWNPQQYYPYESGYLSLEKSAHLTGNGCENCHGPASQHVAAENGDIDADDALLDKLRKALHLTLDNAERQCMECHDLDNSPDFHVRGAFEKYWSRIRH